MSPFKSFAVILICMFCVLFIAPANAQYSQLSSSKISNSSSIYEIVNYDTPEPSSGRKLIAGLFKVPGVLAVVAGFGAMGVGAFMYFPNMDCDCGDWDFGDDEWLYLAMGGLGGVLVGFTLIEIGNSIAPDPVPEINNNGIARSSKLRLEFGLTQNGVGISIRF